MRTPATVVCPGLPPGLAATARRSAHTAYGKLLRVLPHRKVATCRHAIMACVAANRITQHQAGSLWLYAAKYSQ